MQFEYELNRAVFKGTYQMPTISIHRATKMLNLKLVNSHEKEKNLFTRTFL